MRHRPPEEALLQVLNVYFGHKSKPINKLKSIGAGKLIPRLTDEATISSMHLAAGFRNLNSFAMSVNMIDKTTLIHSDGQYKYPAAVKDLIDMFLQNSGLRLSLPANGYRAVEFITPPDCENLIYELEARPESCYDDPDD